MKIVICDDMVDETKAFIYKKKRIEPKPESEERLEGQVHFSDI